MRSLPVIAWGLIPKLFFREVHVLLTAYALRTRLANAPCFGQVLAGTAVSRTGILATGVDATSFGALAASALILSSAACGAFCMQKHLRWRKVSVFDAKPDASGRRLWYFTERLTPLRGDCTCQGVSLLVVVSTQPMQQMSHRH